MKYFSLLIFAVSISIVPNVLAEDGDYGKNEKKYTVFGKRAQDQVVKPFEPKEDNDSLKWSGSEYQFGGEAESIPPRIHDPFASAIVGEDGKGDKELPADKIPHSTFMFPAMGGMAQLMKGDAIRKGTESYLNGETAEYFIAYAQVEPGIAQGLETAYTAVNTALSNTYNAYNTFVKQPFENEEVKKKFLTIMNECIYKKMQKEATWVQAVSQCLGDPGIVATDKYKVNEKDTKATRPELEDKLHPSHSENRKNAVVKNMISVAAELFNYGEGNSKSRDTREKLYDSWLTMFGDYQFKIGDPQDGVYETMLNYNMYKLIEKRIPPKKRLAEIEQILLEDRFYDFMMLASEYCTYMATLSDPKPGQEVSFWYAQSGLQSKPEAKKYVFRLSTPEKYLSGGAVEIPVNLVMSATIGFDQQDRWKQAAKFFSEKAEIKKIITATDGEVTGAKHKAVLFAQGYARHVAISQMIRSIYEAINFVGSRTGGTGHVNDTITDRALRLIDDVVKIDDLDQMYVENSQSWDEFITSNFFTAQVKDSGNGLRVQTNTGNNR